MVAQLLLYLEQTMPTVDPRHFVEDQFPTKYRHLIPTTLKTAYRAAASLIDDNPILAMAEMRCERGRIVAWAVDLGFSRLVETGALPMDKSWEYFARPTGRYLALRPSHSVITISQIADPTKQPRNVVFRQNARVSNQPFLELPGFEREAELAIEPHILITHGHQDLEFSHLCLPDPDHRNGYRYKNENLLHLPHEIEATGPAPEDTDIDLDAIATLKDDIDRLRRDHGDSER